MVENNDKGDQARKYFIECESVKGCKIKYGYGIKERSKDTVISLLGSVQPFKGWF